MPIAANADSQRGIKLIDAMIRRRLGDAHATDGLAPPKDNGETAIIFAHGVIALNDGKADVAAAHFKRILDTQPLSLNVLKPVSSLYYGRALAKQGKTDESRKAYDAFLEAWKNADPNLPLLAEAKKEYARL